MVRWIRGFAIATAVTVALGGGIGCGTGGISEGRHAESARDGARLPLEPEVRPASFTSPESDGPTVDAIFPARSGRGTFYVDYRVTGVRGPADRVELWVTPDQGAHWRLLGYDQDCRSPHEVTLDDGDWGLWWVAGAGDVRGEYPGPGDAPSRWITVDTTPPTITFEAERVWAESTADGGQITVVEVPFRVEDPHLDPSSIHCEVMRENGPWRPAEVSEMALRTRVPAGTTMIRIRARAWDELGHTATEETTIRPTDYLEPPSIAFVDPPRDWIGQGNVLRLGWRGAWPSYPNASAVLELRTDGSEWRSIAADLPVTGSHSWRVPSISGDTARLRVRLVGGSAGEESPADTAILRIDTTAPTARLLAPSEGRGAEIPLLVESGDWGGSGVETFVLWRWDGTRWASMGEAPAGPSIQFRPGEVGEQILWLVARDAAGLESEGPPVDLTHAFTLLVREDRRQIELISFQSGGSYPAGGRHLVFFRWHGGDDFGVVVHLEWSPDDGANWVRRGSVPARVGRVELELPREEVAAARVRVVAEEVGGLRSEHRSAMPFRVDARAPEVEVTAVVPDTGKGTEVHFEFHGDRSDPVARVILYHRKPGEPRWRRFPTDFTPRSPLRVELPPGSAVELRAVDGAGNEGTAPNAGVVPRTDLYSPLPPGKPSLELLTKGGRSLIGGSRHYVFWKSAGAVTGTVRLDERIGIDGSWTPIARELPTDGRVLWTAPEEDGTRVWLRVAMTGLEGEVHAAVDEPFTIDGSVPTALFMGPERSRGRYTIFEARVADQDGIERLEAWVRHVSMPKWRRVAESRVGQPLRAELEDGMYHVVLVAIDRAGNRSETPTVGGEGQGNLLVDTVPPSLIVDEPGDDRRLFKRGGTLIVRPRVTDANLSPFPLAFRTIVDGTLEGKELKRFHPNATEFAWVLPTRPGVHTLEVIAEDLAGNRAIQRIPVTVIPTPPRPLLVTDPGGEVLAAGEEFSLAWTCEGVEPEWRGVRLEITTDGTRWDTILEAQPADGSGTWQLPTVDSNRCRLRILVTAPDGMRGSSETGPFTISSSPPKVRAGGIRPAQRD